MSLEDSESTTYTEEPANLDDALGRDEAPELTDVSERVRQSLEGRDVSHELRIAVANHPNFSRKPSDEQLKKIEYAVLDGVLTLDGAIRLVGQMIRSADHTMMNDLLETALDN